MLAGLLAVPVSLFGAEWAYFDACGFELPEKIGDEYLQTMPAPNIKGFWIRKTAVLLVLKYRGRIRGPVCTAIMLPGQHEVVVIGSPEEVMKRLGYER